MNKRSANNASTLSRNFSPHKKREMYDYKNGILNRHLISTEMLQTKNAATIFVFIEQAENY